MVECARQNPGAGARRTFVYAASSFRIPAPGRTLSGSRLAARIYRGGPGRSTELRLAGDGQVQGEVEARAVSGRGLHLEY